MFAVVMPLIIFRNSFSVFNFGKVVFFRTLIEALIIVYIPLVLKYPQFRPFQGKISSFKFLDIKKFIKNNLIFSALTIFTTSYAVSTFLGVNWHKSFWGEWERMGGLFSWLHFYAFFIMIISIFKNREDWLNLMRLSVFVAVISSIYGFLQKSYSVQIVGADERYRILGTIGNPAAFAGYLIFNLFFAFYLLANSDSKKEKIFLILSVILFILAIILTAVRGAFLALMGSILLFLLLYLYNLFKRKLKLDYILVSVILLLIIGGILFLFSYRGFLPENFYSSRLLNFSLEDQTIKNRLIVWGMALEGIFNPSSQAVSSSKLLTTLLGWGPENFDSVFSLHYNPEIFRGSGSVIFDRAHNIFLDITATQGIIGLIAFLFLWLSVLFSVRRDKNASIFFILIFAYFVHNFFFFDLAPHYLMLMIFWGVVNFNYGKSSRAHLGLGVGHSDMLRSATPKQLRSRTPKCLIVIFLAVLMVFLAYYANIRPALANYYSTRGFVSFFNARNYAGNQNKVDNEYKKATDYFYKAINLSGWLRSDILRKFSEAYTDTITFLNGKVLKGSLIKDANFLVQGLGKDREKKKFEFPSYIYEYKTQRLLGLYINLEEFNKIKEKQLNTIDRFPKVVELYYDLADSEFFLNDYDGVISAFKKAYKLNPNLLETRFRLGRAYILKEKTKYKGIYMMLNAVLKGYRNKDAVSFLGSVLEKEKLYDKMIYLFKILSNDNPKYKVYLSYSYFLSGNKKEAKRTADEAFHLPLSSKENEIIFYIYKNLNK